MSRKHGGFDEDDYWDEEEDYDYDDDYYDEYDDVAAKPAGAAAKQPQQQKGGGKGKGTKSAAQAAPAVVAAVKKKAVVVPKAPAPVSGSGGAPPFKFDTPSPDDVVANAQEGRKIDSSQYAAAPTGSDSGPPVAGMAKLKVSSARDLSAYIMDTATSKACEEAARQEDAEHGGLAALHLVVLGHVDAGKSTLMGRLLHDLGLVDQRTVHKNQKEAAQAGKASFSWAWLLDERPEERARGVTVDVAVSGFQTPRFNVTLLDAPGHRDFIPNMITGAAQADAALLLVDGSMGGFESGFEGDGQTREHAQLARSLGIGQIAVVVSKLDTCEFSSERFLAIKAALEPFLRTCGFKEGSVQWLPAVGPTGENLVKPAEEPRLAEWWSGPTLVGAIDGFSPRERNIGRPFRMPISEVLKSRALGGDAVAGKVETGALLPGAKVMLQPGGEVFTVKALEAGKKGSAVVRAGDSAAVGLTGLDPQKIAAGVSMLCHPDWPCPVVQKFEAKVAIIGTEMPIVAGQPATLHVHVGKEEAAITALVSLLDSKTGEVKKAKPRCLLKGQSGVVEVQLARPLCMETYADIRALGRVTLRDGGATIAVGIVERLIS